MEKVREKGNVWGLRPIGIFLVLFLAKVMKKGFNFI